MPRMLDVLDRIRALETDFEREGVAAQDRWHYKIDARATAVDDLVWDSCSENDQVSRIESDELTSLAAVS